MGPLSVLTVLAGLITVATSQGVPSSVQCFGNDGSQLDATFTRCSNDTVHSGCCATRKTSGPDVCLEDGLCLSTSPSTMGMIFQEGCTDSSSQHEFCPNYCPNQKQGSTTRGWNMQVCDVGTYCCRAVGDTQSCCNDDNAPRLSVASIGALDLNALNIITGANANANANGDNPTVVTVTRNPQGATGTPASTGSPFDSTAAASEPNVEQCEMERRQSLIIGSTLGGLLLLTIISLSILLVWMYQRERKQRKIKEHYEDQFTQTNAYRKAMESQNNSARNSIWLQELQLKSTGTLDDLKVKLSGPYGEKPGDDFNVNNRI